MKKNFKEWFSKFRESIATFDYYVDFEKVLANVEEIKVELCILNSLLGEQLIEQKFTELVLKYPEIIKVLPILLAIRNSKIYCQDDKKGKWYSFSSKTPDSIEDLIYFMQETKLFDLFKDNKVTNLIDYITGVEVGLDSNSRKNRGGDLMENQVESFIQRAGFVKDVDYFKEMKTTEITKKWGINLDLITHEGKAVKKFDFVLKTSRCIYGIETNFYASSGSKLNETARSYKKIATEAKNIEGFKFVWITDGLGWKMASQYLEETFEVLDNIYCLDDLIHGSLEKIKNEEN